jgi:Flp pilus assembly pilin Flp
MRRWIAFWNDEQAVTAIEYCLIAGFVSIMIVAGVRGIGNNLNTLFYTKAANAFT